jgi:hypothetical protein
MKFMAGFALKLGEARGDLPGVNFRTGIPDPERQRASRFVRNRGLDVRTRKKI